MCLLKARTNKLFVGIFFLLLILALLRSPVYAATQVAGTLPLAITNVSATSITQSSAIISWNTSDNGTSQVFYDTVAHPDIAEYAANVSDSTSVVTHSISLTGLASSTTYHYRVCSNIKGTDYISDDYTFTTLSGGVGGGGLIGGVGLPSAREVEPGVWNVSYIVNTEAVFIVSTTIRSADDKVSLDINKLTVGKTKEGEPLSWISILKMAEPPDPPEGYNFIGFTYDLKPDGATFSPTITLTFTYDPDEIPEGVSEEDLVIAMWDKATGEWIECEGCTVDPVTHTITAPLSHFTPFAVIGAMPPEKVVEVAPRPAPAVFIISNLTVQPAEVQPRAVVTITASLANTGGTEGSYTIVLKINGVKEAEKSVTVAAGGSELVSFSVTREEVGNYSVTVDGLSAGFSVVKPSPLEVVPEAVVPEEVVPEEVVPEEVVPEEVVPAVLNWGLTGVIIAGLLVVVGLLVYFLWWRRYLA